MEADLRRTLKPEEMAQLELRRLPAGKVTRHGLLYLPRPYVVPGGRFNEMYGWDSYFIQVGLLRDGEVERARDMVDNFLYEIEHYGTILNANRTYYLTRSQPPFLTRMMLGVYERTGDRDWLRSHAARRRQLLPVLDDRPAPRPVHGPLALLRLREGPGAGGGSATRGTPRGAPTTTACASTTAPTRSPTTTSALYYDPKADRLTAALLQGRPLDARVGLRPLEPLRTLQRWTSSTTCRCA